MNYVLVYAESSNKVLLVMVCSFEWERDVIINSDEHELNVKDQTDLMLLFNIFRWWEGSVMIFCKKIEQSESFLFY